METRLVVDIVLLSGTIVFAVAGQNAMNFGTVLYTSSDFGRKWTDLERIELQRRMLIESLVPTESADKTHDDFGNGFLEYFALLKRNVDKIDSVVVRKRAMVMVADAIGAYLHARLLPEVRALYYEGKFRYSTAKRLHDLMKKIKYVLDTDGRGWARPSLNKNRHGQDASSTADDVFEALNGKPEMEATERCGGIDTGPYGLSRRRRWSEDDSDIPYFDNNTRPHSLVVPWRPRRPLLYGVRDAGCHRALFDHCGQAAAKDVYVHALHSWLDAVVSPLVTPAAVIATVDWYPALWGMALVARHLQQKMAKFDDGDDYDRDYYDRDRTRPDVPNANFYAAIVLASTFVCCLITILYTALSRDRFTRCLCSGFGHMLCIRQSTDSV